MANAIASTVFPNVAQTIFTPVAEAPLLGDVWEGEVNNPGNVSYFLPAVVEVAQVTTITLGNNTGSETLTITIDGVSVTAATAGSLAATAAAVEAAIEAPALLASIVGAVTASPVVTLTFLDYEDHVVEVASSGSTTIVAATPTVAVANAKLDFGMHVAKRAPVGTINAIMGQPSTTSDQFAGVLFRTPGAGGYTETQTALLGYSSSSLPPGKAYLLAVSGLGIVVPYSGTAPTVLDPVYRVCSGSAYGKFAASALTVAGSAQVTRGDVVFNGTDLVGLDVDSLVTLSVASDTSDDITAAALRDAWNASPAHFAVATASIDLSGTPSYIILTFKDEASHTVAAYSPATADITGITNTTTAVATTSSAVLLSGASWGKPSISGVSGQPNRAFLRLSPA